MSGAKVSMKTQRLVVSALMIGLGTALSLVSIGLPFGGSVTLGSMAPLVVVSQLYGFEWGAVCCTVYGILQLVLGLDNFSYATTIWAVLAILVFDYIAAYGAMSLSALTRRMKSATAGAALGSVIGCAARFVCHFITGVVVWSQWASADALPGFVQGTGMAAGKWLIYSYSFFYNLGYMLPETVITAVAAAAVMGVLKATKEVQK